MDIFKSIQKWIKSNYKKDLLIVVSLTLLIVYLFMVTGPVWETLFQNIKAILMPFIFGFAMSFVIIPVSRYFEKFGLKRQLIVPVLLIVVLVFFAFLFASLVPKLVNDVTNLVVSGFDGVQTLIAYISELTNTTPSPIVTDVINEAGVILKDFVTKFLDIPNIAGGFINVFITFITNSIFSIVIALYVVFDYENIVRKVTKVASSMSPKVEKSLIVITSAVRSYLKSLVILMTITFVEYTLFYVLTGHSYGLMLGVLQAFGLLIPYVGAISMQVLAILTSLTLPFSKTTIITLGILVLSNVDSYLISPLVYRKRDKIDPLSSLFVFFTASTLFGFAGLLISMPLYFSIRAVYNLKKNNWILETESDN